MPETSIKIKGLPEFQKALRKAPQLAEIRLKDGLKSALAEWQNASEPYIPVDTGRLKRESLAERSTTVTRNMGILEPNVEYAAFVHEGTRYMKPRRFFEKGKQAGKRRIQKAFTEQIQKLFDEIKFLSKF